MNPEAHTEQLAKGSGGSGDTQGESQDLLSSLALPPQGTSGATGRALTGLSTFRRRKRWTKARFHATWGYLHCSDRLCLHPGHGGLTARPCVNSVSENTRHGVNTACRSWAPAKVISLKRVVLRESSSGGQQISHKGRVLAGPGSWQPAGLPRGTGGC